MQLPPPPLSAPQLASLTWQEARRNQRAACAEDRVQWTPPSAGISSPCPPTHRHRAFSPLSAVHRPSPGDAGLCSFHPLHPSPPAGIHGVCADILGRKHWCSPQPVGTPPSWRFPQQGLPRKRDLWRRCEDLALKSRAGKAVSAPNQDTGSILASGQPATFQSLCISVPALQPYKGNIFVDEPC